MHKPYALIEYLPYHQASPAGWAGGAVAREGDERARQQRPGGAPWRREEPMDCAAEAYGRRKGLLRGLGGEEGSGLTLG